MDKKKLQQILIILPIALGAGIWAYFHYLLSPLNARKKTLAGELEQIKKDYNDAVGKTVRLARLQQEIYQLNEEIAETQKKLPANKDVPYIIRLLSKKMTQYQIAWTRLTPGSSLTKDYYIEHSYTIPFKTTYHNLAMFLSEIGQMERIFTTRFSSLRPEIDPLSGLTLVSGELTFLIYTAKGI